jgi:hypothetical protein
VHAIAADKTLIGVLAGSESAVIWTPRSEAYLYGSATPVLDMVSAGITVCLSPDWVISGSMNLLRELRCAHHASAVQFDGLLSDATLLDMCTRTAAKVAQVDDQIGALAVGKLADFSLYWAPEATSTPVTYMVNNATVADVALVVVDGRVLYGDSHLMNAFYPSSATRPLSVCCTSKRLFWEPQRWGITEDSIDAVYAAMQHAHGAANVYPIAFDDCVAPPPGEPTCEYINPPPPLNERCASNSDCANGGLCDQVSQRCQCCLSFTGPFCTERSLKCSQCDQRRRRRSAE